MRAVRWATTWPRFKASLRIAPCRHSNRASPNHLHSQTLPCYIVNSEPPSQVEDVDDDIARELAFYTQVRTQL